MGTVSWSGRFGLATVQFDKVAKIYPDGTRAVDDFDLEIGDGEFMVLVGPSGCGKTTALRMVAGLEAISEGVLRIGEREAGVAGHQPAAVSSATGAAPGTTSMIRWPTTLRTTVAPRCRSGRGWP